MKKYMMSCPCFSLTTFQLQRLPNGEIKSLVRLVRTCCACLAVSLSDRGLACGASATLIAPRGSTKIQDSKEQRITDAFSNDIALLPHLVPWECEFEELQDVRTVRLGSVTLVASIFSQLMYIRLTLPYRASNSPANQTAQPNSPQRSRSSHRVRGRVDSAFRFLGRPYQPALELLAEVQGTLYHPTGIYRQNHDMMQGQQSPGPGSTTTNFFTG